MVRSNASAACVAVNRPPLTMSAMSRAMSGAENEVPDTRTGAPVRVSGTSFSAPLMSRLVVLGMSGGRYSAIQVTDALRRTAKDTPEPAEEEGAGAWNLALAMGSLGATTTAEAPAESGVSWRERLTIAVARVLGR